MHFKKSGGKDLKCSHHKEMIDACGSRYAYPGLNITREIYALKHFVPSHICTLFIGQLKS